jgi:hypothetical protein
LKIRYLLVILLIICLAGCAKTNSDSSSQTLSLPIPNEVTCQTAPQFEALAMDNFKSSETETNASLITAYATRATEAAEMARLGYEKCDKPK